MHRRTLLQATAAMAASQAAGARAQSYEITRMPLRLALDFRPNGQTAPFFLALAKGYFDAEGLDLAIDTGNGAVTAIQRLANGDCDVGLGDMTALVEFHAQNPGQALPSAVYQYYNRAPFVIIGRKDRGVTHDFRSLQGRRIAAGAVDSTRRAFPMVARRLGLGPQPFTWVTTDFSQRDAAVAQGEVDGAAYFHDSAVSLFRRVDPTALAVLPYTSAGVDLYGNAVLASPGLIGGKPQVVAAFLRAVNRAIAETLDDPVEAMAAVTRRDPTLDAQLEADRWRITAQYVAAPDTRGHGLGDIRPGVLDQQVRQVVEAFGLGARPATAALFNRSFLPPRAQRDVKA